MLPGSGQAVGRDWVFPEGDDVIVVAARALAGWNVSKYRKTSVEFDGKTWFVAEVQPPAGRHIDPRNGIGHRYRLTPWPETLHDHPAHEFVYDEAFVAERDRDRRIAVRRAGQVMLFLPFYPVLGLLPSNVKSWLEARYGVRSETTTRQSLRLEYITALVFGGMIVPTLVFDDPFGLGLALPAVVGLGALVDFLMRWDRAADERLLQYGAFEWLFRRLD